MNRDHLIEACVCAFIVVIWLSAVAKLWRSVANEIELREELEAENIDLVRENRLLHFLLLKESPAEPWSDGTSTRE